MRLFLKRFTYPIRYSDTCPRFGLYPAGLKCRSQVTGQVTGYRPQATGQITGQVTGQVTGHRSQATGQVTGHTKTIGHWTKLF